MCSVAAAPSRRSRWQSSGQGLLQIRGEVKKSDAVATLLSTKALQNMVTVPWRPLATCFFLLQAHVLMREHVGGRWRWWAGEMSTMLQVILCVSACSYVSWREDMVAENLCFWPGLGRSRPVAEGLLMTGVQLVSTAMLRLKRITSVMS